MKATSIHGKSPAEIKAALEKCLAGEQGFRPTLAIVFISVKQDRKAVCEILNEQHIDIVGATSSGEFTDTHQSDGEIVILLLDIRKEHYAILFSETKNKNVEDAAREAADKALSIFRNPAFILCSTSIAENGWLYDGANLVHSIREAAGGQVQVFGAMSGDDGMLKSTYVFTATQSTDEGFVIWILDNDKIDLHGMAVSGWKPAGRIRTVTECEGEWIYTIDDQPALDMYLRYLGQSLHTAENTEKISISEEIGFHYPFLAIDAGEPSLRTPIEVNKEKNAIRMDKAIPQGKHLQFALPPDFDIVETVLDNATSLKKEKKAEADALLIFSCLGRRIVLGPMVEQENEGLQKIWNVPLAGFYTYGEYGIDPDSDYLFHSTTCCWVALKEK